MNSTSSFGFMPTITNIRVFQMVEHLHHVHLFTADINSTIKWWRDMLGGNVIYDGDFGGARNVFMRVGSGRIHFYEQRLRDEGKGAVHHLGIRTDSLQELEKKLTDSGVKFRSGIHDFGSWKYIMCPAPDNVLLELFEVDENKLEGGAAEYFSDMPSTNIDF